MIQRLLLCTDLDRTLLPNGPQPESHQARERFSELVKRPEVTLVYVTGRHLQLVEEAVATYQLPMPDYLISDVGSSIYAVTSGRWVFWDAWEVEIATDWAGKTHAELAAHFSDIAELRLQEDAKQNRHKLSYYLPLSVDSEHIIATIDRRLEANDIQAKQIYSVDEAAATGLLDILPASAGKRHAIEFLMERKGFTLENTIFSGDSGNDLEVLSSPIQAVLVANATTEVKQTAQQQASRCGYSAALYLAKGGYLGMNGNYSAGILEGISHYMPQADKWFGRIV